MPALVRRTIPDDVLRSEVVRVDTVTRTGEYICTCPYCGRENHFYINRATQRWQCKRCWTGGDIVKLLRFLGKTDLLGETVETVPDLPRISSIRDSQKNSLISEPLPTLPRVRMPVGWRVLRNGCSYLESRGVSADLCKRYEWGETALVSAWQGYVIVPVRDGGVIRGYVARWAGSPRAVATGRRLRYRNSAGTNFAYLLFGIDEIVDGETRTVIVVEGVFDKIAVDRALSLDANGAVKCVATFGKKISDVQMRKLLSVGGAVETIVVAWDIDARREIITAVQALNRYGGAVRTRIAFTRNKDWAECTEEEIQCTMAQTYTLQTFIDSTVEALK